jgi:dephospho-CoA kinase
MLLSDGNLDRAALGALVFQDPEARQRLNAIVHPRVRELAKSRFAELGAAGDPLACYEVPLLVETGQVEAYRPVVVVSCSEARQLERLQRRDGISEEAALKRVRSQTPLEDKVRVADYVIDNEGTVGQALERATQVLGAICEWVGVAAGRYG